MDHAKFFAGVRTSVFGGRMNASQVAGTNLVLAEAEAIRVARLREADRAPRGDAPAWGEDRGAAAID